MVEDRRDNKLLIQQITRKCFCLNNCFKLSELFVFSFKANICDICDIFADFLSLTKSELENIKKWDLLKVKFFLVE